jgi:hypothetical protein
MPSEAVKVLPGASGFAKLFAGLTARKSGDGDARSDSRADEWIDDILAPDVATISYERALRAHARYRRPDPPPPSVTEIDPEVPKPPQSVRITERIPENNSPTSATNRKLSSVTVRMSHSECDQLRERATAAGLTVSAYLRSCIFEVEALRAQVKEALLQIQSNGFQAGSERPEVRDEPSPRDWRTRLFAHWSRNRHRPDA